MGQVRKSNFGLKPFLLLLIKTLQTSLVFKDFQSIILIYVFLQMINIWRDQDQIN